MEFAALQVWHVHVKADMLPFVFGDQLYLLELVSFGYLWPMVSDGSLWPM